jgi:hypothetical protein
VYDYLIDLVNPRLDYDVWSCRPGKGLHAALERTQALLRSYPNAFVWRADIRKFFDHVRHDELMKAIHQHTPSPQAIWLCLEITDSYNRLASKQASKQGIPIGNLTSQIFANIYLNEFDRFVRHVRKPAAYLRYGDDFIVLESSRPTCLDQRQAMQQFLTDELGLFLHPDNDIVVSGHEGLHFLGHWIYAKDIVIDTATKQRLLERLRLKNSASYQALHIPKMLRKQFPWVLHHEIEKILDVI